MSISARFLKPFELSAQFPDFLPALFIGGPFLLGKIAELASRQGLQLPVEQLWKFTSYALKLSGTHTLTLQWMCMSHSEFGHVCA